MSSIFSTYRHIHVGLLGLILLSAYALPSSAGLVKVRQTTDGTVTDPLGATLISFSSYDAIDAECQTGSPATTSSGWIWYEPMANHCGNSQNGAHNNNAGGGVLGNNNVGALTSSNDYKAWVICENSGLTVVYNNVAGQPVTFGNDGQGGSYVGCTLFANDAPTFSNFSSTIDTTNEDTEVEITFAELSAKGNETDGDGSVTAFVVEAVSSGSLRIGVDAIRATNYLPNNNKIINGGNIAYWTPASDASGTLNAFSVKAQDNGAKLSSTAIQAQVSVTAINDAPVIDQGNLNITIDEDNSPIAFSQTLTVTDPDVGDTLTWSLSSAPNNGSITVSGTGVSKALAYVPNNNYFGADSFDVSVDDGNGETDSIAVSLTISPRNDQPSFSHLGNQNHPLNPSRVQSRPGWAHSLDMGTTDENSSQSLSSFIVNVISDPDTVLTLNGIVNVDNTGQLNYALTGNTGSAQLEVFLQDDGGASGTDLSIATALYIGVGDLSLTTDKSVLIENDPNPVATVTISRSGNLVDALTVNLNASDNRFDIPATVTILAGQTSVDLPINLTNNFTFQGYKSVALNAISQDYSPSSVNFGLKDDDPVPQFDVSVDITGQGQVDGTGIYYLGDVAHLTETADLGWTFSHWEGDCNSSGSVEVDEDKRCGAIFIQDEYALSVSIIGEGQAIHDPAYLSYDNPSLVAQAAAGWAFEAWGGDCAADGSVLMDADKSCILRFTQLNYGLTLTRSGEGTVTGMGDYLSFTTLSAGATADEGWVFDSWSGDCAADGSVLIDAAKSCHATFKQLIYPLAITIVGEGEVLGAGDYPALSTAILTTNAAEGWRFLRWQGDCDDVQVLMDSEKQCQAIFGADTFELSVSIIGEGEVHNTGTHPALSRIVLSAVRAEGWLFSGWGSDCDSAGMVVLDVDKHCSATFEPMPAEGTPNPMADLAPELFANISAEELKNIDPVTLNLLDDEQIAEISIAAFQAFSAEQLANLNADAIAGISPAQLASLPPEALSDLNSRSIAAINPLALQQLKGEQILAFNPTQINSLDSKDLSGLLTNLASGAITPLEAKALIPEGWAIDPLSGAITVPPGSAVRLRKQMPENLAVNMVYPREGMVDLNSQLALGGQSTQPSALTQIEQGLNNTDTSLDYVMSQSDNSILNVQSKSDANISLAFVPDPDNMFQLSDSIDVGLYRDEGGFFTVVTSNGQSYKVLPAPANPEALPAIFGENSQISFSKEGSVFYETEETRRAGRSRRVLVFDPVVEPVPEEFQICFDRLNDPNPPPLSPEQAFLCEGIGTLVLPNSRRAGQHEAKVIYPDGRSQKISPAFLEANGFASLGEKISGVESIRLNANGTFVVNYLGQSYLLAPRFDVDSIVDNLAKAEIKIENSVQYHVPFTEKTNTRRAGRSRRVLVFDPVIEPLPEDMCEEIYPGQFRCDFGDGTIVHYPEASW